MVTICKNYMKVTCVGCRSQWPCGLRCRSSAARLLRSWVRIPPGAWMFVCYECCVLSGRGLCDGLITRPDESYRLWLVVVCDLETSKTRRLKPATGLWKYSHNGLWRQENKQTNKNRCRIYAVICNSVRLLHNNYYWIDAAIEMLIRQLMLLRCCKK